MADTRPATVLFIEDQEAELRLLAEEIRSAGVAAEILAPEDVELADLEKANLVVVDYNLGGWLQFLQDIPLSAKPPNGVAVASVLREHVASVQPFPPTGFALITGKGEEISRLPSEQRAHVISRLSNLEWFFEKQAGLENATPICSLSSAIQGIPEDIGSLGQIENLAEFLGTHRDDVLFERYCNSIHRCRPPIHNLAIQSHGITLIRWLLHRILPHATFLIDTLHLAARLLITPDSLVGELTKQTEFTKAIGSLEYDGPLSDFDGTRWWTDGIEQWLWEITNHNSDDPEAIHEALRMNGFQPQTLGLRRPVVTLDPNLKPETEFAELDDVVAVSLDDWPSYAQSAYMRKSTIRENTNLTMYVDSSDRARL
jgi:hypothetical protein